MEGSPLILKNEASLKTPSVYGCTNKGMVRSNNEDYFGYYIPTDNHIKNKWGSLFAVSDGVGGNAAGEVASAEAVNVLLQEYYFGDHHSEKPPERLKNAFQYTARHIYDLSINHSSLSNMQCTLTALSVKHDHFYITHVGDSRAYLLRSKKLIQLTKDHSLVGKLVRLGLISPEDARSHPNRHILLKALGERPILPADFYSGCVWPGDLFCLITDGIIEHITTEELESTLVEKGPIETKINRLIEQSNDRGGYDNMTILIIKINEE